MVSGQSFRLGVPDWLPALVNAGRAFVAIGAVELFWIGTAWPNGASTIVFVAIVLLLLSPRGDLAYGGAIAFTVGTAGAVLCAAMIKFAVLPALQTFPGPVDKAGSRAGPQRGDLPTSDDRPGRWSDHCAHVPGHD